MLASLRWARIRPDEPTADTIAVRLPAFCRAAVVALVLSALGAGWFPAPARAGGEEDKLLSITKMTLYGALLGGLLGTCVALVVESDHRDDAIRWGIAGGAFGGFLYGVVTPREGAGDVDEDLSVLRARFGSFVDPHPNAIIRNRISDDWVRVGVSTRSIMSEVDHDGCQEQAQGRIEGALEQARGETEDAEHTAVSVVSG